MSSQKIEEAHKHLIELGVAPNEAKLYFTLVRNGGGPMTAYEMLGQTSISPGQVYIQLAGLVSKGLAVAAHQGKKKFWRPVPPETVGKRLTMQVRRASEKLIEVFQDLDISCAPPPAYHVDGRDSVQTVVEQLIFDAQSRVEMFGSSVVLENFKKVLREKKSVIGRIVCPDRPLFLLPSVLCGDIYDEALTPHLYTLMGVIDNKTTIIGEAGARRGDHAVVSESPTQKNLITAAFNQWQRMIEGGQTP